MAASVAFGPTMRAYSEETPWNEFENRSNFKLPWGCLLPTIGE